jgi:hypothetical protein
MATKKTELNKKKRGSFQYFSVRKTGQPTETTKPNHHHPPTFFPQFQESATPVACGTTHFSFSLFIHQQFFFLNNKTNKK